MQFKNICRFSLAGLSILSTAFAANEFTLDCTDCPQSCNNDCYATYVSGKPGKLHYPGPPSASATEDKRTASGCDPTSPCGDNGVDKYKKSGNSCDEYPYASVDQGGAGAILRCVDLADNKKEGSLLSGFYKAGTAKGGCNSAACDFTLFFLTSSISKSPFCMTEKGPNDGFEFVYKGGKYVDAKKVRRDSELIDRTSYDDSEPDPSLYVPLAKRREFLLTNGERVLLAGGDMETDYTGRNVTIGDEENPQIHGIARELLDQEKSAWFRPSQN